MHSLKNGTKCWGEISHENPPLTWTDPKKTVKKKENNKKMCYDSKDGTGSKF